MDVIQKWLHDATPQEQQTIFNGININNTISLPSANNETATDTYEEEYVRAKTAYRRRDYFGILKAFRGTINLILGVIPWYICGQVIMWSNIIMNIFFNKGWAEGNFFLMI